jgi:hypothetical protein
MFSSSMYRFVFRVAVTAVLVLAAALPRPGPAGTATHASE